MPVSLKSVERLWTAEIWRFNVLFIFIGFVGCIFGPRKINTWWSFCCAKCGWNWCSTFDNMQVALFSTLGLKVLSLFMSPKWEFWGGGFHPISGEWQQRDLQRAHAYVETLHVMYWLSKSVYWQMLSTIPRIKEKEGELRNQNIWHVTCLPRPAMLSQRHMDLHMWSYPRHSYIF